VKVKNNNDVKQLVLQTQRSALNLCKNYAINMCKWLALATSYDSKYLVRIQLRSVSNQDV